MSGDCMLIEGIEVIKDENGVRWMDFDGLFSKVWSAQDGVVLYGDRARSESMNGAFAQIREKWKRIERFQLPGGTYRLRYLVTEQGASQFAASYRHHKMEPFQDWLFETVLPQIRNTGTYTHLQTTGNPVADLALHISKLGEATAQAVLDAEKASKIAIEAKLHADIANENADKANKIAIDAENDAKKANEKVDEVALRLDELTGGNFALTARQALLRMGVNPEEIYRGSQTNAMALGAYAAKWHRAHNVPMPPKIPEGTYMVGVYSRDALRDGVKALGISAQQAIH